MRRTVNLDKELEDDLKQVVSLTNEKPATVIREALRAGLRSLTDHFQALRPKGYFASEYPRPQDRQELEAAMTRVKQRPDR